MCSRPWPHGDDVCTYVFLVMARMPRVLRAVKVISIQVALDASRSRASMWSKLASSPSLAGPFAGVSYMGRTDEDAGDEYERVSGIRAFTITAQF